MPLIGNFSTPSPAPTPESSGDASIGGAGGAGPTTATGSIAYAGIARTTGATQTELFGVDMPPGTSWYLTVKVQCHPEGTHAAHGAWFVEMSGQRASAGASQRTCSSGGGLSSGQTAMTFLPPGRPSVVVSDPSSAVAPNIQHRLALLVTGKAATNIIWSYKILQLESDGT